MLPAIVGEWIVYLFFPFFSRTQTILFPSSDDYCYCYLYFLRVILASSFSSLSSPLALDAAATVICLHRMPVLLSLSLQLTLHALSHRRAAHTPFSASGLHLLLQQRVCLTSNGQTDLNLLSLSLLSI